jgi:uncharacterized membrane protein
VSIKERFNLIARKLSIWNNFFPIKMSFFEALLAPNYHHLVLSQEIYHIERSNFIARNFEYFFSLFKHLQCYMNQQKSDEDLVINFKVNRHFLLTNFYS